MFWTPASRARYSLDWVFILDPWFTGIVLVSLILSLVFRNRRRRIAAAGAGLLCAYIAFCALVHARALADLEADGRAAPGRDGRRPAAVPVALPVARPVRARQRNPRGLLRHRAVRARCCGHPQPPKKWTEILSSLRDYYPPPARATIQRFERPPASAVLDAARALPEIGVYIAFARFPLETVYPAPDGGAEVIVQDLRFLPWFTGPWERGGAEGIRRQPFVYRVRFDPALRPVERGFVRGGRR